MPTMKNREVKDDKAKTVFGRKGGLGSGLLEGSKQSLQKRSSRIEEELKKAGA